MTIAMVEYIERLKMTAKSKSCPICFEFKETHDFWQCDVCKKIVCADCVTWQNKGTMDIKCTCSLCGDSL